MYLKTLKQHFNLRSIKTKGLTLLIEHAPCCLLSLAAGVIGLPLLNHNPVIELGFAIGGAFVGEYIGHKYFHGHKHAQAGSHRTSIGRTLRRYGLSLAFGLASWGLHQKLFHHHHDHDSHYERHDSHKGHDHNTKASVFVIQ